MTFRARQLEAGEPGGRVALPADILADRAALAGAQDDLDDAAATHERLAARAQELAGLAEQAAVKVRAAAITVMQNVALLTVQQVREAEARAAYARVSLMGFANIWSHADQVHKPVPMELTPLFHEPVHGPLVTAIRLDWRGASIAWSDFLKALLHDPDAVFEPPA